MGVDEGRRGGLMVVMRHWNKCTWNHSLFSQSLRHTHIVEQAASHGQWGCFTVFVAHQWSALIHFMPVHTNKCTATMRNTLCHTYMLRYMNAHDPLNTQQTSRYMHVHMHVKHKCKAHTRTHVRTHAIDGIVLWDSAALELDVYKITICWAWNFLFG